MEIVEYEAGDELVNTQNMPKIEKKFSDDISMGNYDEIINGNGKNVCAKGLGQQEE